MSFLLMSETAIQTTGVILERKGEILYRVELMNGKVLLGHLSKPLTEAKTEFADGAKIRLELTPYDFDQARILSAEA
ncbi:translation initiation factor IF-1 [Luteolibacter algae]|uniref:Translation initiation factor IF-1 n=1 Tax=Luteolibacter algae TaxID=454151 RepID=A0ABW5D7S9_9BACT